VIEGVSAGAGAKTILLVTHRLSTLAICDKIYRMANGRLEGPISYDALALG
jgi:ABC-type transport system involved in cytochrome bd biosynthesis fused ATPase/permease subunit